MDVTQPLVGDVGVDLGGRHVLMPQQLLDAAEVGAVGEKVGGIGVPQGVGRHLLCEPGEARIFCDQELDGARVSRLLSGLRERLLMKSGLKSSPRVAR
jgi:hypothetical protein